MERSNESTAGNRLSFMVRSERGHVVSWSLVDRGSRLMLAHSRGRREIDGRQVDHDPNVALTADIMGAFFEDPSIEARLLGLVDSRLLSAEPLPELPHASGAAELP